MEQNADIKVAHYVEFVFPNVFMDGSSYEQIKERKDELVHIPEGAYAYRFFDRTLAIINGEVLLGEKRNYSNYAYIGTEYSLSEIKRLFPKNQHIIEKLECCEGCRAIRTIAATWAFVGKDDTVISVDC